jgi:hypothetical protein
MTHYVYALTGQVSINGEFQDKTWLAFFLKDVGETDKRKFLGRAETVFPIKYPLHTDKITIQEGDYYSSSEE